MLNPIEKFKRSILHLNRSLHHCTYISPDYNSPLIYWWGYCNLSIFTNLNVFDCRVETHRMEHLISWPVYCNVIAHLIHLGSLTITNQALLFHLSRVLRHDKYQQWEFNIQIGLRLYLHLYTCNKWQVPMDTLWIIHCKQTTLTRLESSINNKFQLYELTI